MRYLLVVGERPWRGIPSHEPNGVSGNDEAYSLPHASTCWTSTTWLSTMSTCGRMTAPGCCRRSSSTVTSALSALCPSRRGRKQQLLWACLGSSRGGTETCPPTSRRWGSTIRFSWWLAPAAVWSRLLRSRTASTLPSEVTTQVPSSSRKRTVPIRSREHNPSVLKNDKKAGRRQPDDNLVGQRPSVRIPQGGKSGLRVFLRIGFESKPRREPLLGTNRKEGVKRSTTDCQSGVSCRQMTAVGSADAGPRTRLSRDSTTKGGAHQTNLDTSAEVGVRRLTRGDARTPVHVPPSGPSWEVQIG